MGCFPCGQLTPALSHLNECYPPSKQLVAAGPDYKPLSQDLSKLVYFAVNKPSQLAKIGEELEKRVSKEARGSSGGYAKSRASLLISLAILKSLITECKRDLNLFSRSALRVIVTSLDVKVYQKGGPDLEVIGRAASCFTAFATYTDGGPIGVDDSLTADYTKALIKFGNMAVEVNPGLEGSEKPDTEYQSRTRLIGLASLSGASGSDALFLSDSDFARQIGIIIPALLSNLFDAPMDDIKLETAKIQMDASPSPFFSEFSVRRPVNDRRAPSLHAHIPGEKGPSGSDVLSAALRSLKALIAQCQLNQASMVLDAVFVYLDRRKWSDVERCCWLTEELAKFTSLQYRFVVPTRLVELLADLPDSAPTVKQSTVLAMITTILNSSVSLVGLGVSDILGNLVSLIIRRVHVDERDALLPPLVQCVASLGTHIYYADQINDIVEEISQRIAEIPPTDKNRSEILRVLVNCISSVLRVVHAADDREAQMTTNTPAVTADKGKGPRMGPETPVDFPLRRLTTSRRNPVAPGVWQETLPLLCEGTYAVRSLYARTLLLYLEREMPREVGESIRPGDSAYTRFSNALHAALFTLAMSACLGPGGIVTEHEDSPIPSNRGSPLRSTDARLPDPTDLPTARTEKGVSFNIVEPTPSDTPHAPTPIANGHSPSPGLRTPPKSRQPRRSSRRVSLPLNRLNSSSAIPLSSFDNVATPLDFAYMVQILRTLYDVMPSTAVLSGPPMLLALDAAAGTDLVRRSGDGRAGAWVLERKRGVREMVGLTWRYIGRKWGISTIEELADRALSALPEPFVIPGLPTMDNSDILPQPDEPLSFMQHPKEGESSSATQPLLDREIIVSALANSGEVQRLANRDAAGWMRRFGAEWTVETALRDSIERFSSANVPLPSDPHFDIASVLLNMDNNHSYHSLSRDKHARPVDISDLRDALVGGTTGNTATTSGAASVTSTTTRGTAPDRHGSPARGSGLTGGSKGGKEDVREVLKDIFRDKRRGGGKGGQTASGVGVAV